MAKLCDYIDLKEGRITLVELADMHEVLDLQDYFADKEEERQERERQKLLAKGR